MNKVNSENVVIDQPEVDMCCGQGGKSFFAFGPLYFISLKPYFCIARQPGVVDMTEDNLINLGYKQC